MAALPGDVSLSLQDGPRLIAKSRAKRLWRTVFLAATGSSRRMSPYWTALSCVERPQARDAANLAAAGRWAIGPDMGKPRDNTRVVSGPRSHRGRVCRRSLYWCVHGRSAFGRRSRVTGSRREARRCDTAAGRGPRAAQTLTPTRNSNPDLGVWP